MVRWPSSSIPSGGRSAARASPNLGQSRTTGGESPIYTGDNSTNGAPPLRASQPNFNSGGYGYGLPPPADSGPATPACGKPPLLPCY